MFKCQWLCIGIASSFSFAFASPLMALTTDCWLFVGVEEAAIDGSFPLPLVDDALTSK